MRSIRDTALLTLAVSAAAVPTAVACNRPPKDPKPTTPCVTTAPPTTTAPTTRHGRHGWRHGVVCTTPTKTATPAPTKTATPAPTATATPAPTATPTPVPTPTPTVEPPVVDDGPSTT